MISLEQYADLCVAMSETAGDTAKEAAIAAEAGVSAADWESAKAHYTAQMSSPTDMGKTAMAFMPLYQAALDRKRGGGEPCTLELYAKVKAEMAFKKDPNDPTKQINYHIVLADHGYYHQTWLECESYWTPRVGSPDEAKYDAVLGAKFRELMQKESDIIFGIVR
jgi:methyl coenzyme M reductase alpha subunit